MIARALSYFYFQTWNFRLWTPPDRKFLLRKIFPHFDNDPNVHSVLFVGVQRYTRGYDRKFASAKFISIERDPKLARFAGAHHIVGDAVDIARFRQSHFPQGLDLVILNGVIGYGVNEENGVERVVTELAAQLNPGGQLVIGYNPNLTPDIELDAIPAIGRYFAFGSWFGTAAPAFRLPLLRNAVHEYRFFSRNAIQVTI